MNSENINKIYELSENYDKCQDKVEKQRIEKELKELKDRLSKIESS